MRQRGRQRSLVNRQHDGQHMRKIRRSLQENFAFVESLTDELVLLIIELKHRLLEIADAAVNEFC